MQLANPLDAGGPNRESLVVHQTRAISRWPLEVRTIVYEGDTYLRNQWWRPLSPPEIAYFRLMTEDGNRLAFNGNFTVEECYWMASSLPTPAVASALRYENLKVIGPALIEGKYYRVIAFHLCGGGNGLTSQVWTSRRWMSLSNGLGCPRIMAAAPAAREELIRAGVDCSPLSEDYDPLAVECDDSAS